MKSVLYTDSQTPAAEDKSLPQPRVYVIVVAYNGAAWIEACLQSLLESHYPVKVIVVDNASSDATVPLVNKYPSVTCVPLDENLGFGKANNIGIRRALQENVDYVFLLNQDTRIHPEAIGRLIACAQEHNEFGILSPVHLNEDGSQIDYRFSRHIARATNPSFTQFLSDLYLDRTLYSIYPISFVNAAAWLISRACLETVGGFDPLLFMYSEDDDYCGRVVFHGFEIGLVPEAVIFHARGADSNTEAVRLSWYNRGPERRADEMMVSLKAPTGTFLLRLLFWLRDVLPAGLKFLLSGDLRRLASQTAAVGKTIIRLPRVYRHRQINRIPGRHWI